MTFHHFSAAHGLVGRECGVWIELLGVCGLMTNRFTGERGLVDIHGHGLKQFPVGRYLFSSVEHHDISNNHILLWDSDGVPVSDHIYRLFIVYLIQYGELPVSFHLKNKRQSCGKKNGHKNTDRLKKYRRTFIKAIVFIKGNAD